uniref:Kappa-actitoxin-Aer3a n=1 Tax=Anemonia erythraea TaxID=48400 RepID=K1A_ANEER|nr:RecName: Full=Kappa-actitoxin-Aer3a; Short=Kappa-AITX-Aer3a; AltName: Full=AnerK; AltName: Full=Potassium channel toxin AETX K; Flags: Precursor [Anemonia erythraea]BAF31325.1 K channel toxin [Anemonia erythraea]
MKGQMIICLVLIALCMSVVVMAQNLRAEELEKANPKDERVRSFERNQKRACKDYLPKSECTQFRCRTSMKYKYTNCKKTCGTC